MLSRSQQAAVIYFAIPKEDRPLSLEMFAKQVAGVAPRTLMEWKKENREFRDALKSAQAQYRTREGDLFAQAARARAMMILMQGMAIDKDADDQIQAAKSVLREVKDIPNAADTVSYKAYSDAQLVGEMFERGFNLPAAELDAFKELVGLEEVE